MPDRPHIVCLCGSTRFADSAYIEANLAETLAGRIVLTIGARKPDRDLFGHLPLGEQARIYERLDALHIAKIDLADEVLILNVDDYIGQSTSRELAHARATGKPVRWWVWPSAHALPDENPAYPAHGPP